MPNGASAEQRWLPQSFIADLGHFEFGRTDVYKRRIKWDKLREFCLLLMSAESDYFAANLGTKKTAKDVRAAYGDADVKVTGLLRRSQPDRSGAAFRLTADERDILAQLRKYVQLRQQTVQVYRDAVAYLHDGPLDYADVSLRVQSIMINMLGYLQHADLSVLRLNAEYELTTLYLLFEALGHIAKFQARDAIQHLCRARCVLANWKAFQRQSRAQLRGVDGAEDAASPPLSFWERAFHSQRPLQALFSFGSNPVFVPERSQTVPEATFEDRSYPIQIGEDSNHTPPSLAVSPPYVSFKPSAIPVIQPLSALAPAAKAGPDVDSKMDLDNKLFEWLCGSVSRAFAKYTFIFQEVLLDSRLRLYPKDRYQWTDNKGCAPLDLLGPLPAELKRPFRTVPATSPTTSTTAPRHHGTSPATIAALQSKVDASRPSLSLTDGQMGPVKRMVEFSRANPGCTLVLLIDTSSLEGFSPTGGFLHYWAAQEADTPVHESADDPSPAVTAEHDSAQPTSTAPEVRSGVTVHADCCQVKVCQREMEARSCMTRLAPEAPHGVDAFHVIVQHPHSGPIDVAADPGLKATVVALILNSQAHLAKEAAPHRGSVLHVPPAGVDRIPFSFYLSQLDQATYACIVSEKAKERGKNVPQFLSRLTDSLRDSNQLGYLVTPRFDYDMNLI
eukprot:GGOE01018890.1.p1 GENE.GGOE01018890.1~~GGOE01018890.1.p1  ORF type:complete len:673 (+),score=185.00 GGOE01018890.1:51-2069(+)